MPHMGPASEASMLDKVVAIASDPVLHKRVLGEFKERQKLAQVAEAKAREAEGKAAAAEKKIERAEMRLEEKWVMHEATMGENLAFLRTQKEVFDKQDAELVSRADILRVHEEQLARDRTENSVKVNLMAVQAEALTTKETDLLLREAALDVERGAIRIREGKFANRLREFNADL